MKLFKLLHHYNIRAKSKANKLIILKEGTEKKGGGDSNIIQRQRMIYNYYNDLQLIIMIYKFQ